MGSVDDTFHALRLAPLAEVLSHYNDWIHNHNSKFIRLDQLCEAHGWTWDEFSVAAAKWRIENPETNKTQLEKYGIY